MTRDKSKLLFLKYKIKDNVTFINNALTQINGNDIVIMDENTKAKNVLYMDGIKCNLLSVIRMCDNGIDVTFHSKDCDI